MNFDIVRLTGKRILRIVRWTIYNKPRQVLSELSTLWKIQVLLRLLPRESTRAFVATLILGAACGLVAVAFHGSLEWAGHVVRRIGENLPAGGRAGFMILSPAIAAWVAGVLLVRSRLPAAGSGIPQVKATLFGRTPVAGLRVGIVKMALCVIQVGGGASLGREGPTVQICASMVPRMLRVFALPQSMLKRFLPVASAAGIAAAFNTPVAAVTFVMEELMGSSTSTAMTGLVVAAAIAAIEEKLLLGGHPLFSAPAWTFDSLASLPSFLFLGILGGYLGVYFHRWLLAFRGWFRGLMFFTTPFRMSLGGMVAGIAAWVAWETMGIKGIAGPGYALLDGSLQEQLSIVQSMGLMPLKFVATLASYSSGGVGGIFSPVLAIGSLLGSMVGWLQRELPWADATPLGAFALVGMGTFFAAVIRAPITSVLILFELTGNYGLILPLMLANMAAFLVSKRMNPLPIYDALLVQDGIDPHEPEDENWPTVGELCLPEFPVRDADDTVADIAGHDFLVDPIILVGKDGICLGMVVDVPIGTLPSSKLREFVRTQASLREEDQAFPALSLMSQEKHRWLPVVNRASKVVGVFGAHEALALLANRSSHPL